MQVSQEPESKFKTWAPRAKDIPGQTDLNGMFIEPPDAANAKCAKPLVPPDRSGLEPVAEVHMVIGSDGAVWWEDDKGNCVSTDNRHPYTRKKH